jgi:hypothetical protein
MTAMHWAAWTGVAVVAATVLIGFVIWWVTDLDGWSDDDDS